MGFLEVQSVADLIVGRLGKPRGRGIDVRVALCTDNTLPTAPGVFQTILRECLELHPVRCGPRPQADETEGRLDDHLARVVFHLLAVDEPNGPVGPVLAQAVVNDFAGLAVGLRIQADAELRTLAMQLRGLVPVESCEVVNLLQLAGGRPRNVGELRLATTPSC
jgi:hypothetical protein